jgi:hypothetical protein
MVTASGLPATPPVGFDYRRREEDHRLDSRPDCRVAPRCYRRYSGSMADGLSTLCFPVLPYFEQANFEWQAYHVRLNRPQLESALPRREMWFFCATS